MSVHKADGYAPVQIGLHWLIAAMVLFQLLYGQSMQTANNAAAQGTPVDPTDAALATAHYWVGISILVLVTVRLAIRLRYGAPPLLDGNRILALAARATHWLFNSCSWWRRSAACSSSTSIPSSTWSIA